MQILTARVCLHETPPLFLVHPLRAEHEKAILYFQRALRLDRSYLSAWTLMGHEYVELKNTGAAIHAYRQAVEISPRDYRAWYALGQTYEILQMPFYALFYYRKATALRPYDARMWSALAGCYRLLNRKAEVRAAAPRSSSQAAAVPAPPLPRGTATQQFIVSRWPRVEPALQNAACTHTAILA